MYDWVPDTRPPPRPLRPGDLHISSLTFRSFCLTEEDLRGKRYDYHGRPYVSVMLWTFFVRGRP